MVNSVVNKMGRALLLFIVTILAVGVVVVQGLLWLRYWNPVAMDDGPFYGRKSSACPERKPNHDFAMYSEMRLLVYDAAENEDAPQVGLRMPDGKLKWCVFATGSPDTMVKNIRFSSYQTIPFLKPRIRGRVLWTYGSEATWWFISKDGELQEYWYSW